MGRNILGVIAGYVAMAAIIFVIQIGGYFVLGPDRVYQPGTFQLSMLYLAIWAVSGLVASFVGGLVCAIVSKNSRGAVLSMIVLMVLFSGIQLVGVMMQPELTAEESVRTAELTTEEIFERGQKAMPVWVVLTNPIIGVVGVMLGATLACPKHGPVANSSDQE
ncbi:MAG: hypothetical protein JJ916_14595 [Phycisphaerales bacterium]|nr:hypothetical protein [Phycisphaerales bacterium]